MIGLSLSVIAISTLVTITHDLNRLKQQLVHEADMVTRILAQDFAKVYLMNSADRAANAISRLRAFPMIEHADVYDLENKRILHYSITETDENHLLTSNHSQPFLFTDQLLFIDTEIKYENVNLGTASYAISTAKINRRLQDIYQIVIYTVPGSVLFSILAAWFLQGFFTRPIIKLSDSARSIASFSDFNHRLELDSKNYTEIDELHQSFNSMLAQLQKTHQEIKTQSEKIEITLTSIGDAVIVTSIDNHVSYMNPAAEKLTGWSHKTANEKPLTQILQIIHSNLINADDFITQVIKIRQIIKLDTNTKLISKSGQIFFVKVSGAPIINPDQIIEGVILVIHDMTEQYRHQQKLEESESRFKMMANASPMLIWMTNRSGVCTFVNKTMTEFTGKSCEEMTKQWDQCIHPDDLDKIYSSFFQTQYKHSKKPIEIEYRLLNNKAEYRSVLDIGNALIDEKQEFHGYIGSCIDITDKKIADKQIYDLAYYDVLTNLPNRRYFLDLFNKKLAKVKRENLYGALLFIDLDRFKTLNDSLGHSKGDLLLQEVAERLKSLSRDEDDVARLGGDEFLILPEILEQSEIELTRKISELAERVIEILGMPYQLDNYEHISTPSIGITLFSKTTHHVEEILKQADTAMYKAKAFGRNRYCFYSEQMQNEVDQRLSLEKLLRLAIKKQQFSLFYQPKINFDEKLIGAEALIRWHNSENQIIPPDQFIPVAEESGLIIEIGHWVIETALQQLKQWEQEYNLENFQLAVNVSPKQFLQSDFPQQMAELLNQYEIQSNHVTLEITEGVVIEDIEHTVEIINRLKTLNCRISLDDFGTGYSSLSYLKRLPLDEIKIDRSFMHDIPYSNTNITIIKTICMVAESFNMTTVAEGVEEKIQLEFLQSLNCHCYQGYYFSPPVNNQEFSELIKQNQENISFQIED